jgi:GNAT superfamily N-acetyltransferase
MSAVMLRDATLADAIEIAAVHIASWRTTYSALLPAEVVAERTQMVPRVELWRTRLGDPARHTIVALLDGVICGFSAFCPMPERPQDTEPIPDFDTYLEALYVLQAAQRRGIGRALLAATARAVRSDGRHSLALHVLATNPARDFYARFGAVWLRDDPFAPRATWYQSVYGWRDVTALEAPPGAA